MSEETCTICGTPLCFADKQTAPHCLDCATSSAERMAEIEARLAAATKFGAWHRSARSTFLVRDDRGQVANSPSQPCVEFIVRAPADLRWLLDRVRELEGEKASQPPEWIATNGATLRAFIDTSGASFPDRVALRDMVDELESRAARSPSGEGQP